MSGKLKTDKQAHNYKTSVIKRKSENITGRWDFKDQGLEWHSVPHWQHLYIEDSEEIPVILLRTHYFKSKILYSTKLSENRIKVC